MKKGRRPTRADRLPDEVIVPQRFAGVYQIGDEDRKSVV